MDSLKKLLEQKKTTNVYKAHLNNPTQSNAPGFPKGSYRDQAFKDMIQNRQAAVETRRRLSQNPLVGGTSRTEEEDNNYLITNSSNNPVRRENEEEDILDQIQSGQPPAKIGNSRGQSGSSGVYRLTVGPLKSTSKPGVSHTVIDSKWENQDEIGLGNVTRPQVEGRDKVTPSFTYTEFVQLDSKKKADGHQLVKRQLEKWKK